MGVDLSALDLLLKFRGRIRGETLQLGRQGLHIPRDSAHPLHVAANRLLKKYNNEKSISELFNDDKYSELLFKYMGAENVLSLDANSYEGATFEHDLNLPVPPFLRNRFDVIFDGGTIEHIFDVRQVFENVNDMLKVGGLFLSLNAANNQLGHGFYQFSPEVMWRIFSEEAGYKVLLLQTVDVSLDPAPIDIPDPKLVGHRIYQGFTGGETYVVVAAEKIFEAGINISRQQSDYAATWDKVNIDNKLTIVTSASSARYGALRDLLSSVVMHEPHSTCIVYDMGLEDWQRERLRRDYASNNISFKKFQYSKHYPHLGGDADGAELTCRAAILKEISNEHPRKIVWCDAGNKLLEPLNAVVDALDDLQIYSPASSGTVSASVHPNCLTWFGIPGDADILTYPNRNAAFIALNNSNPEVRSFIDIFYQCSIVEDCFIPKEDDRANHSQEQATFTILYYFYKGRTKIESIEECLGFSIGDDIG